MGRRRGRWSAGKVAAAVALLLGTLAMGPAAAQGPDPSQPPKLFILAGNGEHSDINMLVIGPSQASVQLFEVVDGSRRPLEDLTLDSSIPAGQGQVQGLLFSIAPWVCGRATRRFVATGATTDGVPLTAASNLRTPSCADRLRLAAPERARPGAAVSARVTDRWKLGDVETRLCVKPPDKPRSCRALRIGKGRSGTSRTLRLRQEGRWRLELRTRYQRIRQTIAVGATAGGESQGDRPSVLLLGDSVMSQLVTPITERFGSRAEVESLIRGGSGLTDRDFDWLDAARRQVAEHEPDVAAMLIGGADGHDLRTPDGALVECCADPWIDEYARRTAPVMRALSRGGRTRVVWVLNPASARPAMQELLGAVNEGVRRALPNADSTAIADLSRVISPGFRFRRIITQRGRRVVVRSPDGIHLSLQGADIAAAFLARSFGRLR